MGNKSLSENIKEQELAELYSESEYWHVNLGETTIHAKRISGKFRNIKWIIAAAVYLPCFLVPYIRWEGKQAILLDIPGRKFNFFSLHIWPQEVWMLALLLMLFFLVMHAVTSVAGRVFCGYFCWQTVWVDVFTWIEEKLEGPPVARVKLDAAPLSFHKVKIKAAKHTIFLLLGVFTGISFISYFIDVYDMWGYYFTLSGPKEIWITILPFAIGTYLGVAFMREQICFWLCPYARIQGVMSDADTIMPTYNFKRGEPRGKIKRESGDDEKKLGDCIDCSLCVAVCPTGIDIRHGQQEGCITCGLCIDACNSIMEKVDRPKELITYISLRELLGHRHRPFYKRGRVLLYFAIILSLCSGIVWGLITITPLSLTVIRERQPLFVMLSNGDIQNKYTLKILNKSNSDIDVAVKVRGLRGAVLELRPSKITVPAGKLKKVTAFVREHRENIDGKSTLTYFKVENMKNKKMRDSYKTVFMGPKR